MVPLVTSSDFSLRHGALLAVGEISSALCDAAAAEGLSFGEYVGESMVRSLLEVAPRVRGCEDMYTCK